MEKIKYLQSENEALKISKLHYVKMLANSRHLVSQYQAELNKQICNCNSVSGRRPPPSTDIRAKNPSIGLRENQETQIHFKKLLDHFVIENEWLHNYVKSLESQVENLRAKVLLNKQLLVQSQENEAFVIKELSERINDLTKQLSESKSQQSPKSHISSNDGDQSYHQQFNNQLLNDQLEQQQIILLYKGIAATLSFRNEMLHKQNNQLIVLNSLLGCQLQKRKYDREQDITPEEQFKMMEIQKKILHFQSNSMDDSQIVQTSKSVVSEDYDYFVFSNRVNQVAQKNRPDFLPQLDIQKAQLLQQQQMRKLQEQQEKQEKQNQFKKEATQGSNMMHLSVQKSDEKSSFVLDQRQFSDQFNYELMLTKKELEHLRQLLQKFQNLYAQEATNNKIQKQQLETQEQYIDQILLTNEQLLKGYKNLEEQLSLQRKEQFKPSDNRARLQQIHNQIGDPENILEEENRLRSKSLGSISYPVLELIRYLLRNPSNQSLSLKQSVFEKFNCSQKSQPKKIQNKEAEVNTSSVNQTEAFDEYVQQVTNRTKLKYYSLEKGNSKANIYFQ